MVLPQFIDSSNEFVDFVGNNAEINSKRFLDFLCVYFVKTEGFGVFPVQRNVQSGNTQNLKSSAAPVRLPAAPASTPGTSQAAAQAGCVYRP